VKSLFKIEGIPRPGAIVYSAIVAKSHIMKDFYYEVAEEVLSKISAGRILDIGTGPGYLPLEIGRKSQGLEIKAIDISAAMVEIARRNSQEMGLSGRVEFLLGSAENIPFEPGYFDLVVSTGSFHHWANPEKCLAEIHRVLKNGGEAWIYDPSRDVSKEVRIEIRNKYGWFLSSLFLGVVRLHSSVSAKGVEKLLSSLDVSFSSKNVVNRGVYIKQELKK
jgi:ubiquinone/menaquinone biosynthesis C-methylase UbiE